jgi:3-oxoacyl-[acyl-carrier-protein] synthase II
MALALDSGAIPPTINLTDADPECDLDYVPRTARELPIQTVVSTSFGFGGQNGALVMKRFRG